LSRIPPEIKTVGVVGLGNMGAPMAANLVRAGYTVLVFDIDVARAERAASEIGARAIADLEELGRSAEAVVTMLPTGRDVHQVLLEAQAGALAAALRPGSVVIDMSSSDPVGTRALGSLLAARSLALVDAPVSGGVPRARDGTLAIMIGGEPAVIARVKPVLAALGNRLFEVGTLGCGHAMKALNNFLAATGFAAAAEAMSVGRRFGLDPAIMIDVVNVSTGRNFSTESTIKQQVLTGDFASGFGLVCWPRTSRLPPISPMPSASRLRSVVLFAISGRKRATTSAVTAITRALPKHGRANACVARRNNRRS